MKTVTCRSLILLLSTLVFSQAAMAHERSWPGKRLAETWPEVKKFTQKQVSLGATQVQWIEKNLGQSIRAEDRTPIFYPGTAGDDAKMGVVLFLDASGSNGKVEIGLGISPDGKVAKVILFENSESKEINSTQFTSQFTGKNNSDKFKVGEDITPPKTGDAAAQAVASAVRRGLLVAAAAQVVTAGSQPKEPAHVQ
jgi:hypothetical protein